jgi:hypothetical protein
MRTNGELKLSAGEEWKTAKLPANYTAAEKALLECKTVDGCREWKNQASAVASYARQSNNTAMLDYAIAIRNRARRRIGEILSGTESQRGKINQHSASVASAPEAKGRAAMAKEAGLSEFERKTALRIAAMPEDEFQRRKEEPGLGQQRGKPLPGTIRCPHCGGVIVL